jgi:uncharacterized membrane protein YqhA
MVARLFASSRYLVLFAVLASFLAAAALMVYGALLVVGVVWDTVARGQLDPASSRHMSLEFIEVIDQFLLATVFLFIAFGLYELFVDPGLPLPSWVHIQDLDDLKAKLVGVITVLLVVTFLGEVVESGGGIDILYLGLGIGAVLLAVAALYQVGGLRRSGPD